MGLKWAWYIFPNTWVNLCLKATVSRGACNETNTIVKSTDSRAREPGLRPWLSLSNLEKIIQPPCNSGSSI